MLTEKKMWALINKAKWTDDHDYKRIGMEFVNNLPAVDCLQLFEFIKEKKDELGQRFHSAWLSTPGIDVSDDSWWDLRAEVVGRGKKFFDAITVKKLQDMANKMDYKENFTYCINFEEQVIEKADVKDLPLLLERVTDSDAKRLMLKRLKRGF